MRATSFGAPLRRWIDVAVVLACMGFAAWITWVHGADQNWDLRNYHVYSGFAFLHGRLSSEFMAASMIGYQNPLPLVPFYAMLAAGWHSLAIGMVLALTHSVNLVLLWMICRRLFGQLELRLPLAMLAMLIGAASPLFIAEIGTSYADITTCIPVLGGVLLLLGAPTRRNLLAAGALLGAAVGLKLTNLLFALAAVAFVFVPGTSWRQRGASLCWLALGGLAGGILTDGYWAWLLYREFHNPVFPFANAIFHSPDFPVASFTHRRFLPTSLREALTFPFYLAIPKPKVYAETFAPDTRFALCFVAGAVALAVAAWRRRRHDTGVETGDGMRPRFLGYVALGWTLWLLQFANGRYFLPLSLLIGPALVAVLASFLSVKRTVLATFVCAVLQLGQLYVAGVDFFYNGGAWNERWVRVDVPRKLIERPYLYLSMELQSNSYLAAFVHPQSRFMNVNGTVPLDLAGPGSERVRQQLARFTGATRILTTIMPTQAQAPASPSLIAALDADLNRFGLRVDTRDCVTIVNPELPEPMAMSKPGEKTNGKVAHPVTLLSCAAVPAPVDRALQAERARAAALFDKIELACPRQFPLRWNGVVMRSSDNAAWTRYYVDTDMAIYANATNVSVWHHVFNVQRLGTAAGLMQGTERVPCEQIRWHAEPTLSLDPPSPVKGAEAPGLAH